MKDNLIIELTDTYSGKINKAKGTADDLGKKLASWLEKFK